MTSSPCRNCIKKSCFGSCHWNLLLLINKTRQKILVQPFIGPSPKSNVVEQFYKFKHDQYPLMVFATHPSFHSKLILAFVNGFTQSIWIIGIIDLFFHLILQLPAIRRIAAGCLEQSSRCFLVKFGCTLQWKLSGKYDVRWGEADNCAAKSLNYLLLKRNKIFYPTPILIIIINVLTASPYPLVFFHRNQNLVPIEYTSTLEVNKTLRCRRNWRICFISRLEFRLRNLYSNSIRYLLLNIWREN